jgi:hypothetical protein
MEEKNAAAVALGRAGGIARAQSLSPVERRKIAQKAAKASARVRSRKAAQRKKASA